MALLNTDLFVIQRPTDAGKHFKLTGEKLKQYLAAGDTLIYKGSRDFTQSSQDPSQDGTGVSIGDIYLNNNPSADQTGGWAANILGQTVNPNDRALWNGSSWDLISSGSGGGAVGVTAITGIEPIDVDDTTAGEPIISVNAALETDASLGLERTSRSGVVSAIAVESDVIANVGTASPNPDAVVPADLLKTSNEEIEALESRVTVNEGDITNIKGDIVTINSEIDSIQVELESITNGGGLSELKGADPIEVGTVPINPGAVEGDDDFGKTETTVSIKDGTTVQKGAVQLQEIGSTVVTSTITAATPGYVDAYYLIKDFSSFGDA